MQDSDCRENKERYDDFSVDLSTHLLSGLTGKFRGFFISLGNLETRFYADLFAERSIRQPVFISGLARSGSTILLEYLAANDNVATHRCRDFPALFTPCWWNRFLRAVPRRAASARERTHRDGIMVTPESPEALEEMLWMSFFPGAHDPRVSGILDGSVRNEAFERFYRAHILKLLHVRGAGRYVCKNNNNISRLRYLRTLFPDCRILVPVREPLAHVASLMKQHYLFREGERRHPRALEYMRRVGHYEFGLDRRPVNMDDRRAIERIGDLWEKGREAQGWAAYWTHVYAPIAELLRRDPLLRGAVRIVRFEELCREPARVLGGISKHCGLSVFDKTLAGFAARIHAPSYYRPQFTDEEIRCIRKETADTAEELKRLPAGCFL